MTCGNRASCKAPVRGRRDTMIKAAGVSDSDTPAVSFVAGGGLEPPTFGL